MEIIETDSWTKPSFEEFPVTTLVLQKLNEIVSVRETLLIYM